MECQDRSSKTKKQWQNYSRRRNISRITPEKMVAFLSMYVAVTDRSHWCEISRERARKENSWRDRGSKRNYGVIKSTPSRHSPWRVLENKLRFQRTLIQFLFRSHCLVAFSPGKILRDPTVLCRMIETMWWGGMTNFEKGMQWPRKRLSSSTKNPWRNT